MLEIALTRIFSVTMWYHFAFVAISVALFGMTVGALAVHLLPGRFPHEGVRRQLWLYSLLFGVSVAVCFAVQLAIPFTPLFTVPGVASVVATCVVISVPFVFSGIVVCLSLTRFPDQVNRLYAVDLIGAGVGCVVLVLLFSRIDGPSLVVVIGALAAAAALAFAAAGHSRRRFTTAGIAVLVLGGFAATNAVMYADGSPILRIIWTKQEPRPRPRQRAMERLLPTRRGRRPRQPPQRVAEPGHRQHGRDPAVPGAATPTRAIACTTRSRTSPTSSAPIPTCSSWASVAAPTSCPRSSSTPTPSPASR